MDAKYCRLARLANRLFANLKNTEASAHSLLYKRAPVIGEILYMAREGKVPKLGSSYALSNYSVRALVWNVVPTDRIHRKIEMAGTWRRSFSFPRSNLHSP